ncbi:hypothetical protein [Rhodococcus gannanensis]|uniref:Dehydratase n=1 Tax=Rhodococcus gannanensis TaxID=1960308 RepID=A0ABW4P4Q7_9NOCA
MTRSTHTRHVFAAAATVALLVTGMHATGVATAQSGSSDAVHVVTGNDPDLSRSATVTVDNVTVTREVLGPNVAGPGGKITFRTTFAVSDGPARTITRYVDHPQGMTYVSDSAHVTYSEPGGTKVTESLTPVPGHIPTLTGPGSLAGMLVSDIEWPIPTGSTVIVDISYRWLDALNPSFEGYVGVRTGVTADISGLGTQQWPHMSVEASCVNACHPQMFPFAS